MSTPTKNKSTLLARMGGKDTLNRAIDIFYTKLIADERLQPFFVGVDLRMLKLHQIVFMTASFTQIPDGFDVEATILQGHRRLFKMGLNEKHYDIVSVHLRETLQEMNIDENLIVEALGVLSPIRATFQKGFVKAQKQKLLLANDKMIYGGLGAGLLVLSVACTLLFRRSRRSL